MLSLPSLPLPLLLLLLLLLLLPESALAVAAVVAVAAEVAVEMRFHATDRRTGCRCRSSRSAATLASNEGSDDGDSDEAEP
jgi:hypothetical protein